MKTKAVLSAMLSAAMASISLRCTNPAQTTGNGSDIGNAAVVGKLYEPDGKTPAAGARVIIRPQSALADTGGTAHDQLANRDTLITDSEGKFTVDTIDAGAYAVEAQDWAGNAALKAPVVISNPESTVFVSDTLKPAGAIKGIILLPEGGNVRKVFVLAYGLDRFVVPDTAGQFVFGRMAEGIYHLLIVTSLDNYAEVDTAGIVVTPGDTTDLGTIELPFAGIPTPRGLTISYDTLKQMVTLIWNKSDTALVHGYNVYRRNVDSNTVLVRINASSITDTAYHDSTGIQDRTYEYRVAALDRNATEGTKSAGVGIRVLGLYRLVDSIAVAPQILFGEERYLYGIAINPNTNTALACNPELKTIYSVDLGAKAVRQNWVIPDSLGGPWDVKYLDDTTFVFSTHSSIVRFSNKGVSLKNWPVSKGKMISRIAVDSVYIYFIHGLLGYDSDSKIKRLNLRTDSVETVVDLGSGINFYSIGIDQGEIWFSLTDYNSGSPKSDTLFIKKANSDGSQITTVSSLLYDKNQNPYFAFINGNALLSTHANARLISNKTNDIIAIWTIPEVTNCVAVCENADLYFAGTSGVIYKFDQ